ncbi:MAG: molybdate ABC transporter substrate-binding protein [Clostridia bacterium]|nr:molybdate ABC transporter substrate-binding protein [Clostridia bacterium]
MYNFKKNFALLILMILIIINVVGCNASEEQASNEGPQSLMVLSGAGLRKPMDEIGEVFKEKYGIEIQYTYASSAHNLSQIELSQEGDVYLAGSLYYYESAKEKDLVDFKKDVAYHIPIIAVPQGNPKGVKTLSDFTKPGVKVVLGDPKSAAIGKVAKKMIEKEGLTEQIEKNVVATAATVNELVVYITMKQGDATIIWEDNVMNIPEVQMIEIPEEKNMIKTIPVCLIKSSKQKESAQKFIDFVVSDEGKAIYKKHGFKPVK